MQSKHRLKKETISYFTFFSGQQQENGRENSLSQKNENGV
jgi:hypothetical protein